MTTISAVTTTKYRVVVEDGGTVRIIGDVTSALSAALSAAAAAASAAEAADNAPVQSVFGRTGNVTLQGSDVTGALGYSPENPASKGQANGYASLDASGLVPAAQLPSYVDDVVEYANVAAFPATGETGKIYVALDTGRTWRWSGSAYAEIVASPGTTDAITEGVSNLFFTNARAVAAIQANDINLGSHTLAAGAGTFASLLATGLITAASSSGFAAGNFFAYDSGGVASVGAAAGSNLRLYSNGVNAVDFNAAGTPTFNAGANVTGALTSTGQITSGGDVAIPTTSRLALNGGSFIGQADAASGRFRFGSSATGSTMLRIIAGGTGDVTLDAWQWDSYTTQKSISIGGSTLIGPTGAAVTGTFSATQDIATDRSVRFPTSYLGSASDFYVSQYLTNLIYNAPTGSGHNWAIANGDKMTLTTSLLTCAVPINVTGTISTTDPAGGAGPAWKLGVAASVSPTSPNRTLRVEIGGTSYYIAAKTTND